MKKQGILLLFILLVLPGAVGAKDYEQRKVLTDVVTVSPTDHLQVSHRWGNVTLVPTDRAEVSYQTVITAKSANPEEIQRMLEEFSVDFSKNQHTVTYTLKRKSNDNLSGNWTIDLTLYLPASLSLDIHNKFGNTTIPDMTGETKVKTEHGLLRTGRLNGRSNEIDHRFGDA
ncbi:MAG: hypothetical protein LUD68_07465 [Rikenellaceae bacterium]|nr:hypothetical protein [Rikenellaceae bacterium]